jgi:hypothetical protein
MTQHPSTSGAVSASDQPTPATGPAAANGDTGPLGQAIQDVSNHAQNLVRGEIELAKAEVQGKVKTLGKGAAIGAAAGLFVLGALLLVMHGIAWLLWYLLFRDDPTYFWGFFIEGGVLLIFAAIAGLVAKKAFEKGSPPTPQMAIDEAQRIRATVQHPEEAVR